MYQWLLFDADNTLWDFSAAEAASLQATLRQTDLEWSDQLLGIYREINHEAWSEYERGLFDSQKLRVVRFERLLERFRVAGDPEELSALYRAGLAASDHLMKGARTTLEQLGKHYRLGLVTNGLKEVQRPRLINTGMQDTFEAITISDEIGIAKPEAGFFDHTFAQMGRPDPAEVLVIGDNAIADIGGAKAYGCAAAWIQLPGNTKQPPLPPDYVIGGVADLVKLLGRS
ncbi:MAG: YjjG family noncanonical pyrimidine nucleotidase [Bacteroidota bacterium]